MITPEQYLALAFGELVVLGTLVYIAFRALR